MATTVAFPDHNEDPKKKGKEWILQFAKAVWNNWDIGMPDGSIFAKKQARYAEIRSYAYGKQSIDKYKKQLLPEDEQDESWASISWDPPAIGTVLRNIAVAKLQKEGYNILCTAINPLAKDAQDEEYANAKIKIMMRQALEQNAPQFANHPSVAKAPGEAEDLEELQMEIDFNPKFIRAKDTEEAIQLVFYENDTASTFDTDAEDFIDFGVGVTKNDLDENNKVIVRYVYPGSFICSNVLDAGFTDMTYAGEIKSTKLSDLRKYFDEKEIEVLRGTVAGRGDNPSSFGQYGIKNNGYDLFKTNVLDLEFISYNKRVTEENKDKSGNLRISKAKPTEDGKISAGSVFKAKVVEVVFKCKWVIGTDLIYDFGLLENMPRSVNTTTMGKTKLSYNVQAAGFFNMKATGLTESMIDIIDDIAMITFKIRHFRNGMVPNGFDIDLSAIENVAMGKGGKALTPEDVLNLFYQKGILITRRSGTAMDQNVNYKAINPIANSMAQQLAGLYNDKNAELQNLRSITGLNELTDGSTPNARMLTTTANLANESTNNALWNFVNARKKLIEGTAKSVVQRLQIALKRGTYDGFNKNTGKWITIPASIKDFDYDLMLEDKPSDDQKSILFTMIQGDIANGSLNTSDAITIINTYNIKQAQQILAYKVKTNQAKAQATALQNTQATSQAQMQSNQQAEQLKSQEADKAMQRTLTIDNNLMAWQFAIAQVKVNQANEAVAMKAVSDITQTAMGNGQDAAEEAQEQEPPQQMQQPPQQMEQPQMQ